MSTLERASVFPRDRLVLVPSRKKKEGEETLIASLSRRCRPFTVSTTLAVAVRVPRIPRVSPLARGSTTVIYDFRLFVETRCASDYSRLFSSDIFPLFFSEFARLFRLSLSRLDFQRTTVWGVLYRISIYVKSRISRSACSIQSDSRFSTRDENSREIRIDAPPPHVC